MTKRLRCVLGLHPWRKHHNEAGQVYLECPNCGKQEDPGARIKAGGGP